MITNAEHARNVESGRVTVRPDGTFTVNLSAVETAALSARLRRYRRNRIAAERGGDWR